MLETEGKRTKSKERVKKPSLYVKDLDEIQKQDFKIASEIEGIDEEIALLRIKIKALLTSDTEDFRLILKAMDLLAKLVKVQSKLNNGQKNGLKNAINNVIKDIVVPLGAAALQKK